MSESREAQANAADQPKPSDADVSAAAAAIESIPATSSGLPPTAQTFWAVVAANGNLVRGFGVISSARLVTGQYQVVFAHDIRGSAYVGTQGFTGSVGVAPSGELTVVGRSGIPNGVFVETFDSAGNVVDRAFHLAVHS